MASREEQIAAQVSGRAPEERPEREDVEARLDKMLADLARVRERAEQVQETAEDIERTRQEIVERRGQIREREAEVREKADIVEQRAEESREKATEIRTTAAETRRRAEEVKATIEAVKVKKESIVAPAPHILEKIGAGFGALEKPFAEVSAGLRRKAEETRPGPRELPDPSDIVGLPGPGQPSRGPAEIIGLGLRAGASAFDAFTMPVRPILLGETVVTTAKLVVDAPTRKAFLRSAAEDPAGFGADIIGGAVGGYALGYGIGKVRTAYTTRRYLLDVPDEAFLVPEEAAFAYPQPETVTKTTVHDYLKRVGETGVVDDFDTYRGPITFDKGIKGFRRTGHEVISELVPDQAQIKTIHRPGRTTIFEAVETFRPAVRFPHRPGVVPRPPLALTTGLGILSSFEAEPSFRPPEEALAVEEEVRIMTGGTTKRRTRPKPTPPEHIEAPWTIEGTVRGEKERILIAPMFKPYPVEEPPTLRRRQKRRQRYRPVEIVETVPEQIQREPFFPGWPTTYTRPRADPSPVYRPELAKSALKRGRGSWRWFGEYRQYLKGDPLKVLEGF